MVGGDVEGRGCKDQRDMGRPRREVLGSAACFGRGLMERSGLSYADRASPEAGIGHE